MQNNLAVAALSALWLVSQAPALAHSAPTVSDVAPAHQHEHAHDKETAKRDGHTHDHEHHHEHDSDDFTQLGAHVHGAASLTLVLEGNELQLALQSAAFNIVGFEQAPTTAEQKQEVALALDNLAQGSWFTLNSDANCEIQGGDANTDLTEPGYSGHGDFYANISLLCQRPALLQHIELGLFTLTPSLEKIAVQWVINGQQGAGSATLNNNKVQF